MEDNQNVQEEIQQDGTSNQVEDNSRDVATDDVPPEITAIDLAREEERKKYEPEIEKLRKENNQLKYLLRNTQTVEQTTDVNKNNWKDKIVKWH